MTLTIKQQDPPVPKVIEGALLEKLVTVMSGLYDTDMHMLDLSSFHKNEGMYRQQQPTKTTTNGRVTIPRHIYICKSHREYLGSEFIPMV